MATPTAPMSPTTADKGRNIKIISHSPLFYWWPVWAVGFFMAFLTFVDGGRMAIVPAGTVAEQGRHVEGHDGPRDVLVLPPNGHLPLDPVTNTPNQPRLHIAASKNIGVLFAVVLLVIIFTTNVPLRGLWSVVGVLGLVSLSVIFAWAGWWDNILQFLDVLHIHMNAFGYLSISLVLFALWCVTILLFDRQLYMVFSPGQLRVRLEIGGGETAYDTVGMTVQKRRDDLFRHWILGIGSGDLIVKTGGVNAQQFDMPNVLFVGRKVQLIQQMLQEREVVSGQLR
jgi:hypothetical protein